MITIKSEREIEVFHEAGKLLASIHEALRDYIKVGVTGFEIDKFVQDRIEAAGAIPMQIGYEGYEYATCFTINDEICHGFPRDYALKSGDIVTIDTVLNLNGGVADSAWTYAIGDVSEEHLKLMEVTREAMYRGIEQAVIGNRLGDIGAAVQEYAEAHGYGVVRDFVGHGIGPGIHEEPMVPNYGIKGKGRRLTEGMTITIEPMLNMGTYKWTMDDNGWTARTLDGGYSAQYEHSIAITKDGPLIMTKQEGQ